MRSLKSSLSKLIILEYWKQAPSKLKIKLISSFFDPQTSANLIFAFPIVFIQTYHCFLNFDLYQLFGLCLSFFWMRNIYLQARLRQKVDSLNDLSSYLKNEVETFFCLEEKKLIDYIYDNEINAYKHIPMSLVLESNSNEQLCRIFVRKPVNDFLIPGQKKGFVIPASFSSSVSLKIKSIESAFKNISMIFIDDNPDDISDIGKFFILHELGHTTDAAWRIKLRKYNSEGIMFGTLIWLWLTSVSYTFTGNSNFEFSLSFWIAFLLTIIHLDIHCNPFTINLDDEVTADLFAITNIPNSILSNKRNPNNKLDKVFERCLWGKCLELDHPYSCLAEIKTDLDLNFRQRLRKTISFSKCYGNALRHAAKDNIRKFDNLKRIMYLRDAILLRKFYESQEERIGGMFKLWQLTYYGIRRGSRGFFKVLEVPLLGIIIVLSPPTNLFSLILLTFTMYIHSQFIQNSIHPIVRESSYIYDLLDGLIIDEKP